MAEYKCVLNTAVSAAAGQFNVEGADDDYFSVRSVVTTPFLPKRGRRLTWSASDLSKADDAHNVDRGMSISLEICNVEYNPQFGYFELSLGEISIYNDVFRGSKDSAAYVAALNKFLDFTQQCGFSVSDMCIMSESVEWFVDSVTGAVGVQLAEPE